ncbi:MAG: HPr family phosphocarrier protein [Lentisphaeria bacterium]|nr:HPr family phosphocarrier protein [Lentisphaeria bacterium]
MSERINTVVTVGNRMGLHARPASRIAMMLADYPGAVLTLAREDDPKNPADCRSVLSLIILAASKGTRLILNGSGEQAEEAVRRIGDFFAVNFEEE